MKREKIGRKKCFNKKNKVHFELNEFSGKMEQASPQPLPLLGILLSIYFSYKEKRN